ncbi:subtilisin-like protein [Colletotrichum falcatum]|nr:subtilisin-like protein [Colletotrichum falcatum]
MVFRFDTTSTLVKNLKLLKDADIAYIFPESDVQIDEEPPTPDKAKSPPVYSKPEIASQGVLYDSGADTSLKALSQPPEFASYDPADMPGYAYPASSGKGITVYIIDTGANPNHDEYTRSTGNKRWIYISEDKKESDSDLKNGHGSCTQSLINGPRFGAAKDADIVIVKLPDPFLLSDMVEALYWVTDDIAEKKLEGKAVVTMSISAVGVDIAKSKASGTQVLLDKWDVPAEIIRNQMELLIYLDVPVVVGSGNNRELYDHIDTFPAALAKEQDIIAVGSMEPDGRRSAYSQGDIDEVTVLAMGQVECATQDGTWETIHAMGTSNAAPRVAGMIATWLSSDNYRERLGVKGKVAANVKNLLKELAYAKMPASQPDGGFSVAYNGFGMFTCSEGSSNGKRDADGGSCQLDKPSTTTISAAITTATPAPVPQPDEDPIGTSVYAMKFSTAGNSTECFPGPLETSSRTDFVYKFTLDSPEASIIFRRSFLSGPYLFTDSGLSGTGSFTVSSTDQGPFWTCLVNNSDKDATLKLRIY